VNLSEKSRKQRVLDYLRDRQGQWVDGTELISPEVGGSEGLRRVRELRAEIEIDLRRHPNPLKDVWQYRLRSTERKQASERRLRDAVQEIPGGWTYIEPPNQTPDLGLKGGSGMVAGVMGPLFTEVPRSPDFGSILVCPRCKGHRKGKTRNKHNEIIPPDPICYEPGRRGTACVRCGGLGIVPNIGPIAPVFPDEGVGR
jgi:hypothetical protein